MLAAEAAFILGLFLYLRHKVILPVLEISRRVSRFAAGDRSARIHINSRDEIGYWRGTSTGIINQFTVSDANRFDRLAFWQHGIVTAVCAQVLAKVLGRDQALAFTDGLRHDVGRRALEVLGVEHAHVGLDWPGAGNFRFLDPAGDSRPLVVLRVLGPQ